MSHEIALTHLREAIREELDALLPGAQIDLLYGLIADLDGLLERLEPTACRVCGCTDDDCSQCVTETGSPCHWVEEDLCSACADKPEAKMAEEAKS